MAERLTLEPEVQLILGEIDQGNNFLLSGGAGSGKTYSLVETIRQVIAENPTAKIACLTYTNAAVKEIERRVDHENLVVSTIHDFLWDRIKNFKKELETSLVVLMNTEDSGISNPEEGEIPADYFSGLESGIQYKEYLKLKEGIISHDEVLTMANHMFREYPILCDILKDAFKFIFIDEYQDTDAKVVEILLIHLLQSEKKNIVGFFGDSMQSIYDDTIGNLNAYKGEGGNGKVVEIQKEQNRRNPQLVIDLANKLRTDGLVQQPSNDPTAPNMIAGIVKQGVIKFFHSNEGNLEAIKTSIGWNFSDSTQTKILNLTHNLIAPNAGFSTLMDIYDKDPIIGLKNSIVQQIKEKKKPDVTVEDTDTFDQVVDKFQIKDRAKNLKKDVILKDVKNKALYDQLKDLPFFEVRKIYIDKDSLVDDKKQSADDESKKGSKRDNLIKHLFKIQNNISLYNKGEFNEFIRKTDFRISSLSHKEELKSHMEALTNVGTKTIESVIDEAHECGICEKDDRFLRFVDEKPYLFSRVKEVPFSEFQNLYNYLEGQTPFSTQHKTKGSEFDNVLVILDNGGWNSYNFQALFEGAGTPSVLERTSKIFYVCCTRAKEQLAIYYRGPSSAVLIKAKEWFGESNVIEI